MLSDDNAINTTDKPSPSPHMSPGSRDNSFRSRDATTWSRDRPGNPAKSSEFHLLIRRIYRF